MSLKDDLDSAIKKVGRKWKKAKRHADKNDRVPVHRVYRMRYYAEPKESIRDVAFEVMESAYMKASSNGKYPANARQIYYAARPEILKRLDKDQLNSQYFTQTILKDYMEENRPGWDVVWDARGHISEPHTGEVIGLGGLEVRDYINLFTSEYIETTPFSKSQILLPTTGPVHRFNNILFIEKEGFNPLLDAVNIPERFDIAITSSKGMPVAALCDLLSKMEELKVTAYCLHDFDVSGFTILKTLKQGARGSHGSGKVIDLGFRIDDIQGLQSEPVTPKGHIAGKLREAGATGEEIEFLQSDRVELNAMTSEEFVNWLEAKLTKVGVKKYVPDETVMVEAYKRALYLTRLMEKEKEFREEFKNSAISIPDDLVMNVTEALIEDPKNSWDQAIWRIAGGDDGTGFDGGPGNIPDLPKETKETNPSPKDAGEELLSEEFLDDISCKIPTLKDFNALLKDFFGKPE
ncbi:MAG: hypothetical protein KKH04_19110 [Proteobacteria bacterium]|nr:hypothetical protein [Pseudomonadota bacterium]